METLTTIVKSFSKICNAMESKKRKKEKKSWKKNILKSNMSFKSLIFTMEWFILSNHFKKFRRICSKHLVLRVPKWGNILFSFFSDQQTET